MNLGELRGAVNRATGIGVDSAALNDWINFALAEIALEDRWPWLELQTTVSLVASTATYTLSPTALRTILYVRDATPNTYDPASIRDLVSYNGDQESLTTQFSDGFWYANSGTQIYIAPTPTTTGGVLTVGYISNEPKLVADIDTPLLPSSYHQAIVERAAMEAVLRRNQVASDGRKADAFMKTYNRLIGKMKREALRYVGPARTPRIRPGAGW